MLDVARVREDFPILAAGPDGRRLIYLDNAATTQKPRRVIDAVREYYETSNANVHRGAYALAVRATELYEAARERVAAFVGAWGPEAVVFTRGTTEAINLVASSWGRAHVRPGDSVVVTAMDHHSNLIPWQLLCRERDATLRMVEVSPEGAIDQEDLRAALAMGPRLVTFPFVSNALGTINPAAELVRMAHEVGAVVLIDGAQAAPHLPVDVRSLDCEFFAFSGHKMLGPMGSGALVAKPALLDAMPPYQGGGEMIARVWDDRATWNRIPHKFEAGTPNVAAAVGLAAAMDYLDALGRGAVAAHESALAREAMERLGELDGVRAFGPPGDRAGVVSFSFAAIHPHDLATIVDQDGVCIRAGHHCAQPLMRRLGVPATARASFYVYNDSTDIEALIGALRKAATLFRVPV